MRMETKVVNTQPDKLTSIAAEMRLYWQADRGRFLHAAKAMFAVLLAVGLSMRLELSAPRTAMVSVVILMMHQHSGMVLARGFYRGLGMLIGSLVGLGLIALFPQERVLFLLALSTWIGLCVCGAAYYRNYQSYGFVLSGYATCIAAVPAISNPYGIFDNVVTSLSEVSIGILCAGAVSALVLPQRVSTMLLAAGQRHFTAYIGFVRDTLGGAISPADLGQVHLRLMAERAQIENLRSAAVFENPELRANNDVMVRLNRDFLNASARFHAIHQIKSRVRGLGDERAIVALDILFSQLLNILPSPVVGNALSLSEVRTLAAQLHILEVALPQGMEIAHATLVDAAPRTRQLFDTGASILYFAVSDLRSYARNYIIVREPLTRTARKIQEPPAHLISTANRTLALIAGLRAMAAILVTSILWIMSGWNGGSGSVIAATIACALFSIMPQPVTATRQMIVGCTAGWLAGLLFNFFLLPHLSGFLLLAVALGPFILAGSYMNTFPKTATIGLGFNIYFCFLGNLTNPSVYDPLGYLDAGFSTLVGIAIASFAYSVVVPYGGDWITSRYLKQLRRLVAQDACFGKLTGLLQLFESSVRDFVQQIAARPATGKINQNELIGWAFSALEIGHGVIQLREAATQGSMPRGWPAQQEKLLTAISQLFLSPSHDTHASTLHNTAQALSMIPVSKHFPKADNELIFLRMRGLLHFIQLSLLDDTLPLSPLAAPKNIRAEKRKQ